MSGLPEFEETDSAPPPRGRLLALQLVAIVVLFLIVAVAVVAGILVTWAAVQPVLPPAPGPVPSGSASVPPTG
jgi:hypothetical protein